MYVTLVTEDDQNISKSGMSKDPGAMDKGKAKNKTTNVKTIPAKKKQPPLKT